MTYFNVLITTNQEFINIPDLNLRVVKGKGSWVTQDLAKNSKDLITLASKGLINVLTQPVLKPVVKIAPVENKETVVVPPQVSQEVSQEVVLEEQVQEVVPEVTIETVQAPEEDLSLSQTIDSGILSEEELNFLENPFQDSSEDSAEDVSSTKAKRKKNR